MCVLCGLFVVNGIKLCDVDGCFDGCVVCVSGCVVVLWVVCVCGRLVVKIVFCG